MRLRPRSSSAFTLIEIVTVIVIILILAGIVVGLAGYVNNRSNRARAEAEKSMFSAALGAYQAETGGFPEDLTTMTTSNLSPKRHFNPTAAEYEKASLFLYKELTGDKTGSGTTPDGIPDPGEPAYLKQFERKKLVMTNAAGTGVRGFQDPWGYFYGYSTAAIVEDRKFQAALKISPSAARPVGDAMPGFNISSYDFWSTAGSKPQGTPAQPAQEWAKWIKNW